MTDSAIEIRPQPGPQEMFLASSADVAIIGGGAGGGKTRALLMEPLRHVNHAGFGAVIFRKTFSDIMKQGSIWDEAGEFYPLVQGKASLTPSPKYTFPAGTTVEFSHLQHEKNKLDWHGSQIPLIEFDELQQFSRSQFFYLLSRNRSKCGVRPYVRASCNPDPDSWLRKFIDWWIGPDGYAIEERSGVIRWLAVINDEDQWADTKQELIDRFGPDTLPISVTFIKSLLSDNPALMNADPEYRSKLMQMRRHERERLLGGNWDSRESAGSYFQRGWFSFIVGIDENGYPRYASEDDKRRPAWTQASIIDALTLNGTAWCRYWDLASTKPNPSNPDPDYCVGALVGKQKSGRYVLADVVRFRGSPHTVEANMIATAQSDGKKVRIVVEREPGSSGKIAGEYLVGKLAGYNARLLQKRSSKEEDWEGLSAQCEAGNVDVVTAKWNDALMDELEALGGPCRHDDQGDACSGGFNVLANSTRYTLQYIG